MDNIKKQIDEIKRNQNWQIINELLESEFEKFYIKLNPEKRMVGLLNYRGKLLRRLKNDIQEKIILKILMGENDFKINDEIRKLLAPLISIAEMYHMYYHQEIVKLAEHKKDIGIGRKLRGHNVAKDRLQAYKTIFENYTQQVSIGKKPNFRSLCFSIGAKQLGFTTDEEKELFYKAFNKFKNKYDINGIVGFEKILSSKGKLID